MQWYNLLIYTSINPQEDCIKAHSKDEAFKKAREYWGEDVIIEFV